MPLLFSALV